MANNYDHVQQNDEGKDGIRNAQVPQGGGAGLGSERAVKMLH
jgi:hypothetical protein